LINPEGRNIDARMKYHVSELVVFEKNELMLVKCADGAGRPCCSKNFYVLIRNCTLGSTIKVPPLMLGDRVQTGNQAFANLVP
jgi:hypothetical protein